MKIALLTVGIIGAFAWAIYWLLKSSKDEPLEQPPIEEWEDVYTNPKYSRWEK